MVPEHQLSETPSLALTAKLSAVELVGCELKIDSDLKQEPGKLTLVLSLDRSLSGEKHELSGTLDLQVRGVTMESEAEIFSLSSVHRASYHLPEIYSWSEAELDHFTHHSMLMHVWAYAREFVSHLTAYTGLEKVTLPLIPFPVRDASEEEEKR